MVDLLDGKYLVFECISQGSQKTLLNVLTVFLSWWTVLALK